MNYREQQLRQIHKKFQQAVNFLTADLKEKNLVDLRTKLAGRTLDQVLQENLVLRNDLLTWQNSLKEWRKELQEAQTEIKALQQELKGEKQLSQEQKKNYQNKLKNLQTILTKPKLDKEIQTDLGNEQITLLTERNKFLEENKKQEQQEFNEQLRKINLLFDPAAKDYETIDFNGLYALLQQIAERERERETITQPPKKNDDDKNNEIQPIYSRSRKKKPWEKKQPK